MKCAQHFDVFLQLALFRIDGFPYLPYLSNVSDPLFPFLTVHVSGLMLTLLGFFGLSRIFLHMRLTCVAAEETSPIEFMHAVVQQVNSLYIRKVSQFSQKAGFSPFAFLMTYRSNVNTFDVSVQMFVAIIVPLETVDGFARAALDFRTMLIVIVL